MTGRARLLALRLHGFKSFAERTTVEFGPGISAIVGPNGSGKSNLADALRWTLGEQGRSLRIRRAEDVIWAGSERRPAQGMADVSLVLDNSDGLLPVDFSVVELGRRLYRSGENDYLLNRQRVRLRDIVDLLDGAHLADNAFLFIGQGMVDQALALRPEERRPLFEEVAGVRRHERRKGRAEEQLAESLANLARVDDILAELRPQARRLAAQAQQQASRDSAAEELADALLRSAHARWREAAAAVAAANDRRTERATVAERIRIALIAAEDRVTGLSARLAARAADERLRRTAHEAAVTRRNEIALEAARLAAEAASMTRERTRLVAERAAAEADLEVQRRLAATPAPARDVELESALADAERSLAEAVAERAALLARDRVRGEELAGLHRARAARAAELETARRRAAEGKRRASAEASLEAAAAATLATCDAELETARQALMDAHAAESELRGRLEAARGALDAADAVRSGAHQRAESAKAELAAGLGRLEALRSSLAAEERGGIGQAARRHGGRPVDAGLVLDPDFALAVAAALAGPGRAYVVPRAAVADLAGERGVVVAAELASSDIGTGERPLGGAAADAERRLLDQVAARGGGRLEPAIRHDPVGAVRRLLQRVVWLPSLADCLAVQGDLPAGWSAVARDGSALVDELTISLGSPDDALGRRAALEAIEAEVVQLQAQAAAADQAASDASERVAAARAKLDAARTAESAAAVARRLADDAERKASRAFESLVREHAWHAAQSQRLAAEGDRLASELQRLERQAADADQRPGDRRESHETGVGSDAPSSATEGSAGLALATWQQREAELRQLRNRLADQLAATDRERHEQEARRARAEARIALRDERVAAIDAELAGLADRDGSQAMERDRVERAAASAAQAEAETRRALEALLAEDGVDRAGMAEGEQKVAVERERLRAADESARTADRTALEAELALESLREQLLVDLAGLGEVALRLLPPEDPGDQGDDEPTQASLDGGGFPVRAADVDAASVEAASVQIQPGFETVEDDGDRLARRFAAAANRWTAEPPPGDVPPPARLAQLRRRVHDLGAANPFAVAEHEAVAARLADLESQRSDLGQAIERTRRLIDELSALIVGQFRATFTALETAFDRRFQQLFGGGFARLELTDPADIGSSGIEITARPPGKRRQPLAMLSGGERSLTAVALLLAMLEVRPVPFCVLDEVDAALDEANVGRFTTALRELARATQFVVITHNRGTIRVADALYGVTVGDDSVSRVISLRLDEARAVARAVEAPVPVDAAVVAAQAAPDGD